MQDFEYKERKPLRDFIIKKAENILSNINLRISEISKQNNNVNDIAMEAIQDALYATNNFTSEQCNKIADGILQYLDDYNLKITKK